MSCSFRVLENDVRVGEAHSPLQKGKHSVPFQWQITSMSGISHSPVSESCEISIRRFTEWLLHHVQHSKDFTVETCWLSEAAVGIQVCQSSCGSRTMRFRSDQWKPAGINVRFKKKKKIKQVKPNWWHKYWPDTSWYMVCKMEFGILSERCRHTVCPAEGAAVALLSKPARCWGQQRLY